MRHVTTFPNRAVAFVHGTRLTNGNRRDPSNEPCRSRRSHADFGHQALQFRGPKSLPSSPNCGGSGAVLSPPHGIDPFVPAQTNPPEYAVAFADCDRMPADVREITPRRTHTTAPACFKAGGRTDRRSVLSMLAHKPGSRFVNILQACERTHAPSARNQWSSNANCRPSTRSAVNTAGWWTSGCGSARPIRSTATWPPRTSPTAPGCRQIKASRASDRGCAA